MAGSRNRGVGELEAQTLRILRAAPTPMSARDIQRGFAEPVPATTTILTVLDRLVGKGEVIRRADSPRRQRFSAARSAEQDASATMMRALGAAEDRRAVLLKFAGDLDAADLALLREALAPARRGR
ncbi:MAG: BlaI/MecI/CopY family transcriptional regulator [Microbacteriaceae bacterium]